MNEKNILVIQTAFIGDAILTLPLIQEISKRNPNSKIDVIAIPSTEEIFKLSPFVNRIIIFDKKGSQKSFLSLLKFISRIKKNEYQVVYSPHRSIRTSLIVLLSGIKNSFGFNTSAISFAYKNIIKYDSEIHEVARNLSLLNTFDYVEKWKIIPEIFINSEIVEKIKKLLIISNGRKVAVIAPGSVWQTKRYPVEHYKKIIEFLTTKNFFIVLIGGKQDKQICDSLLNINDNSVASFAGKLTLTESIELLKKSVLLICNDSAPTHMGMLADIPVITIYCSTSPSFGFYPYNNKSDFVSYNDLNCKPCGIHGHNLCPIKTFDCGYKLLPEEIINKIQRLVN